MPLTPAMLSGLARPDATGPPPLPRSRLSPGRCSRRAPGPDSHIERIRTHLRRHRELSSQGKWSEAGQGVGNARIGSPPVINLLRKGLEVADKSAVGVGL